MKKQLLRNISVLFCGALLSASSAGAAVTFDWALIGNPGNAPDDTGFGAVDYEYSIMTTEVTKGHYVAFLNAVAKTDTYGLYNGSMESRGIIRSGSSGNYSYSLTSNDESFANRPIMFVSWYDTLRFTNWLHNGQLTGAQDATTTEYGVYDMSLQSTDPTSIVRLPGATYWLPSEDEWYKAAYYSPSGVYYTYATGTDAIPNNNSPENDTGNSVNCSHYGYLEYTTVGGAYDESGSPYGTYDQNGNLWEWNENYIIRGGSWGSDWNNGLAADYRNAPPDPTLEDYSVGFRIASDLTGSNSGAVPEPMSIGLMILSLGGLILRRVKKA